MKLNTLDDILDELELALTRATMDEVMTEVRQELNTKAQEEYSAI